jgi:hypothetical protein
MQDKIAELQNQLNNTTANTTAYEAIKAELDAIIEKA